MEEREDKRRVEPSRDLATRKDELRAALQPIGQEKEQRQHSKEIQRLKDKVAETLQRTRHAIDSALHEAKKELDEIEQELGKQIDALQSKEAQFEEEHADLIELKRKLSQFATSSARVKLDIGGTRFVTTRQTLCKESSMLSAMLNFNVEPDEDGAYFIDRNPKYFEFLLEYLRSGQVELLSCNYYLLRYYLYLSVFNSSFSPYFLTYLLYCLFFSIKSFFVFTFNSFTFIPYFIVLNGIFGLDILFGAAGSNGEEGASSRGRVLSDPQFTRGAEAGDQGIPPGVLWRQHHPLETQQTREEDIR